MVAGDTSVGAAYLRVQLGLYLHPAGSDRRCCCFPNRPIQFPNLCMPSTSEICLAERSLLSAIESAKYLSSLFSHTVTHTHTHYTHWWSIYLCTSYVRQSRFIKWNERWHFLVLMDERSLLNPTDSATKPGYDASSARTSTLTMMFPSLHYTLFVVPIKIYETFNNLTKALI